MRRFFVRQSVLLTMGWLVMMGDVSLAKEDSARTELMMFVREDREARIQLVKELKEKVPAPSQVEVTEHEEQE